MHPATNATFAISGSLLFIGILFFGTGTPIPIFDSTDDEEIQFSFSGTTTTLLFEQTDSGSNHGWAVYTYGIYNDSDGDGSWDDCSSVEISLLNESGEDFHYSDCAASTQRKDVPDMIYIGQFCFNPNNSSSPRCSDGNYSMEASQFVRISQEFEKPDMSVLSSIASWIRDGLVSGVTLIIIKNQLSWVSCLAVQRKHQILIRDLMTLTLLTHQHHNQHNTEMHQTSGHTH